MPLKDCYILNINQNVHTKNKFELRYFFFL